MTACLPHAVVTKDRQKKWAIAPDTEIIVQLGMRVGGNRVFGAKYLKLARLYYKEERLVGYAKTCLGAKYPDTLMAMNNLTSGKCRPWSGMARRALLWLLDCDPSTLCADQRTIDDQTSVVV
jgi:hypothetical protein